LGKAVLPIGQREMNGTNGHHATLTNGHSDEAMAEAELRHGLQEGQELDALLNSFFYWLDGPLQQPFLPAPNPVAHWRNKDRPKTAAAALVVCMRLGVEPPDVVKTNPCATLECWVETAVVDKDKALAEVGQNLEKQYSSLVSSKLKYRQYLDCKIEDAKRLCTNLRKTAKHERGLFHYNGHGVPKPTSTGEIWVFDKDYTQYIPVSLQDVLSQSLFKKLFAVS
jgi:regulator-associated protein of mTOR